MRNTFKTLAGFALVPAMSFAVAQSYPAFAQTYSPVTDALLMDPPDEEWILWRGNLSNHGYSNLDQVNTDNVADLRLEWAWAMPAGGLQEMAPLVHDGIMFLGINQSIVQALDATTGDLIWEYTPILPEFTGGYHERQASRQKNTIALYEDKVYLATADAKLVALDALTGQVVWEVQVHDWEKGYSYTAGPLVVAGKVFLGVSGCSMTLTAGGCYITAHDAESGEELWRLNTLDDPNNPEFEASWGGLPTENRWGATPWTTGSYDPELNMLFWGTGMPIPYPEIIRGTNGGDVLYTNSTLAIDADTGEIVWYYQHLPRDEWDLDSPFERVLVETAIAPNADEVAFMSENVTPGEERSVVVTVPGKYGTTYVLDRETGELLWARHTAYQNVIAGFEPDGSVITNAELIATSLDETHMVCGGRSLGKLWMAGSYSPPTDTFYVPISESCRELTPEVVEFAPGSSVGSQNSGPAEFAPGEDTVGRIYAINVGTGELEWVIKQQANFSSSVLATAGGLLFAGDGNRVVYAIDQESGDVLWDTRLNTTIAGHPMTYEVDGRQYVAIATGPNAQTNGSLNVMVDVSFVPGGNSLFVFALPEQN